MGESLRLPAVGTLASLVLHNCVLKHATHNSPTSITLTGLSVIIANSLLLSGVPLSHNFTLMY